MKKSKIDFLHQNQTLLRWLIVLRGILGLLLRILGWLPLLWLLGIRLLRVLLLGILLGILLLGILLLAILRLLLRILLLGILALLIRLLRILAGIWPVLGAILRTISVAVLLRSDILHGTGKGEIRQIKDTEEEEEKDRSSPITAIGTKKRGKRHDGHDEIHKRDEHQQNPPTGLSADFQHDVVIV